MTQRDAAAPPERNYAVIAASLKTAPAARACDAGAMQRCVDALWNALAPTGVSWLGFYLHDPDNTLRLGATRASPLVLGPHRDKPACSPIGLKGVCGQALTTGKTRIVHDVTELGNKYIACDPRDASEIVIPLVVQFPDGAQRRWGVLDVDSHTVGAFDTSDDSGLRTALDAAGLLLVSAEIAPGTQPPIDQLLLAAYS